MFAILKFQKAAKNLPPPKVMPFKCHGCNTGFSNAGGLAAHLKHQPLHASRPTLATRKGT